MTEILNTPPALSVHGTIKKMIDAIIKQRGRGNPMLESVTRTKLLLKGINAGIYDENTPDDLTIINKLTTVGKEFGVNLSNFADQAEAKPQFKNFLNQN